MVYNENRTVLDLQARLELSSKKNNWQKQFCYCCPYVYSASYLPYDRYPEFITYDDYKKKLDNYSDKDYIKKGFENKFFTKSRILF